MTSEIDGFDLIAPQAYVERRIDTLELSGEPRQIASSFVVGLKHLPVRYRVNHGG